MDGELSIGDSGSSCISEQSNGSVSEYERSPSTIIHHLADRDTPQSSNVQSPISQRKRPMKSESISIEMDPNYKAKRERNNEAVRKTRQKQKQAISNMAEQLNVLLKENEDIKKRLRELAVEREASKRKNDYLYALLKEKYKQKMY